MHSHEHLEPEETSHPPYRIKQRKPVPDKNIFIMMYTVGICLSCFYLETQVSWVEFRSSQASSTIGRPST